MYGTFHIQKSSNQAGQATVTTPSDYTFKQNPGRIAN